MRKQRRRPARGYRPLRNNVDFNTWHLDAPWELRCEAACVGIGGIFAWALILSGLGLW